jgi:16S rRNA (uracil1498-N3)-methyltransferase
VHRFFVTPSMLRSQPVVLTGEQAHRIRRVLRMRLGERVELFDGLGNAYEALLIAMGESDARLQVVGLRSADTEPHVPLALCQAVLKGDHFAWVLQKCTEAGVSRFVPMVCDRNVVDDLDGVESKRERWERIIREAAEQSGRSRLPELAPAQLFAQAAQPLTQQPSCRLLLWEDPAAGRLSDALAQCNLGSDGRIELFVGPEGGFTPAEVELARRYGVQPVSLGPRILRAETAGLVAVAAIMYATGEC